MLMLFYSQKAVKRVLSSASTLMTGLSKPNVFHFEDNVPESTRTVSVFTTPPVSDDEELSSLQQINVKLNKFENFEC